MRADDAEDRFRRELERDPGCNSTRLAKQHGLSNRAASRILEEVERSAVRRRRRRMVLLLICTTGIVGELGWIGLRSPGPRPPRDEAPPKRDRTAVALERDLYRALDERDPARVAEAVRQLGAEDESLRLAALRYLVTQDPSDNHQAMLALLDDPSDRVRPAAIQLLSGVPGSDVDERLLDLLLDAGRPQSERLLACASLEKRTIVDRVSSAQRTLGGLLDPSEAIRDVAQRLLERLTGKTVTVAAPDAKALHAAWQRALAS